ncbi:E3 ubiquitin- ligase RHA2B-like [Olea europaea subsp. europaea]|uniref:E3 ubiquitin- ligase RHA2B-like n=1 Tax=Olea europaea subsp. europaea TaxID=158383 RepID=A0A8S0RFP7_OLEEU|nr:E3 ubiquitin- ligase RHA2B-like [Olea europaea subsp. europaea]
MEGTAAFISKALEIPALPKARIDDGDEIRELGCNHLFHRVCLDRWLGYGHMTCPLCRNNVKPPQLAVDSHQKLKRAWNYLVYPSFFQPYGIVLPEYVDDLDVTRYEDSAENENTVECAVCLCWIGDGDEIRELTCNHLT